jgi:hypothetical protein
MLVEPWTAKVRAYESLLEMDRLDMQAMADETERLLNDRDRRFDEERQKRIKGAVLYVKETRKWSKKGQRRNVERIKRVIAARNGTPKKTWKEIAKLEEGLSPEAARKLFERYKDDP